MSVTVRLPHNYPAESDSFTDPSPGAFLRVDHLSIAGRWLQLEGDALRPHSRGCLKLPAQRVKGALVEALHYVRWGGKKNPRDARLPKPSRLLDQEGLGFQPCAY